MKDINQKYMPSLDGLRAVACLLVVLDHILFVGVPELANTHQYGSFGVLVFFSLSGFLMGYLYTNKDFDLDNSSFYTISRFSRITPAYYIAILFCLGIYLWLPDYEYQMTPTNTMRSFAFMGSEGVFWSIPLEVQFYGYFLLIWFAAHKARLKNYTPLILITATSIVFIATKSVWPSLFLPAKLHIFMFGFLASQLLHFKQISTMLTHMSAQIAIVIMTIVYLMFFINNNDFFDDLILPVLVALGILSLSVTTPFTKILTVKIMRFIGAASFSIYLFHDSLLRLIDQAFYSLEGRSVFVLSFFFILIVIIPSIFYIFIESPLNKGVKAYAKGKYLSFKQVIFPA